MATNEELLREIERLRRENLLQATRLHAAEESAEEAQRRAADAAQREADAAQREADAAQRAAEAAQQAAEAVQQAADAAQRAADAAQRADAAEEQLQPTDYLSYLSLCHHKLFLSLKVQTRSDLTSAGGAANAKNKRYPLHLRPWDDFSILHGQCQQRLEAAFGDQKLFRPAYGVDMVRDFFMDGSVADEEDMKQFQCFAVEAAVRFIANKYLSSQAEPSFDQPTRPAKIRFLNNPYGLLALDATDDGVVEDDNIPAYVPTMTAALKQDLESRGRTAGDGPPPAKRTSSPRPRVYPDQWCFKVDTDDVHVPIFVVEYKAAHKLPAVVMTEALLQKDEERGEASEEGGQGGEENDDDDDDAYDTGALFMDVIRALHSDKAPTDSEAKATINMKRITAQVIAQAFHYMVEFGLCYAYVASGEALLLLHLRPEDAQTLYYHLALPGRDVSTDAAQRDGAGNLHNTAIALVLSLVLMGLETPVLTQRWKQDAYAVLKVWPEPYPEMEIAAKSGPDTNTAAQKPDLAAPTPQDGCGDPTKMRRRRKDDDDDNSTDYRPPPPPRHSAALARTLASRRQKRSSSHHGASSGSGSNTTSSSRQRPFDPFCRPRPKSALPYCTQACLLGVRSGGPLDRRCPNVGLHECAATPGRHPLTAEQLVQCVRAQLAEDLDDDCEALDKYGKYGATSMLFRLVLRPYGYSLVAKGVQRPHAGLLAHERAVYEDRRVAAQQGRLVPVCLGLLALVRPYIAYTGAHVSHMLLLSYGGEPLWKRPGGATEKEVDALAAQAWAQLGALGVVHGDERAPNAVWNEERQAVMCIDFGMAQIRRPRKRSPDRSPDRPQDDALQQAKRPHRTPRGAHDG